MRKLLGHGELLLYLDFDGVLHHENVLWHPRIGAYLSAPEQYKLFQHIGLLETLLEPYPQVRIVLSTAWVCRYGCAKSAKQLGPRLRQRVIGATFHSRMDQDMFTALPRGKQVWEDVRRRKPSGWIALDDDGVKRSLDLIQLWNANAAWI
ncbi:HAD domain-containing protein [Rhodoferax sp. TBRC 17660]|uniref:HAD domain-containing protein n=2 Tax=Rhodoferax potami TaxID=3068338 RepID=A0ABU3KK84_9BURK|nr:HAD domain-containing protein [Rhodoferax sp. TBRC 17660]